MARKGFNKYGAKKVTLDGIKFDSIKEMRRYADLTLLERAGEISGLERQVKLELHGRDGPLLTRTGRKMKITVDFRYTDNRTGLTVWEDAKGYATRDYEVRRAVAAAQGVNVTEV